MHWILLPLLAAFFLGTYNVFLKISSEHINEVLGLVILQAAALILALFVYAGLKIQGVPIEITRKGFWFAVLAGIFVGLAELTSFYVFSRGTEASVGIPIIIGGSVFVATLISALFLKENITSIHYFGVMFVTLGIYLLAK